MLAAGETESIAAEVRPSTGRAGAVMRLIRFTRTGTIGAVLVGLFVLLAILAPLIAPADPNFQDLPSRAKFVSPQHLLGTDLLGRDMLSRILYGSRVSLTLGISAVVLGIVLGLPFGLLAGYLGGYVDLIVMR